MTLKNRHEFQIYIKTVNGKYVTIYISPLNIVKDIKRIIHRKEDKISFNDQMLICASKLLYEDFEIKDTIIHPNALINVILKLRGG